MVSKPQAQTRRTVFFVMLAGLAWTDLLGQAATGPVPVMMYTVGLHWRGGQALCNYHGFMIRAFQGSEKSPAKKAGDFLNQPAFFNLHRL